MLFAAAVTQQVDHPVLSNDALVERQHRLAVRYGNRSIVQQNALRCKWDLLQDDFAELRLSICSTAEEFRHFRQVVINVVMAMEFPVSQSVLVGRI